MTESALLSPLLALIGQMSANVLLDAVLTVVVAGVAAFFGAYLRQRGEDRALCENFDEIRNQLRTTTRDTETIKQHLTSQTWRSQQQWSAREQYYSKLLTHLHHFKLALDGLSDYYIEPGTEYIPDDQRGDNFHKLRADVAASYDELQKLLGPAAIFLSAVAVESLAKLFTEHWHLSNFGALCTADYVAGAHKLATAAYERILHDAKDQLGVGGT